MSNLYEEVFDDFLGIVDVDDPDSTMNKILSPLTELATFGVSDTPIYNPGEFGGDTTPQPPNVENTIAQTSAATQQETVRRASVINTKQGNILTSPGGIQDEEDEDILKKTLLGG